jgi:hypothetical protein
MTPPSLNDTLWTRDGPDVHAAVFERADGATGAPEIGGKRRQSAASRSCWGGA